jgi:tryptophanyl-tRNA synthetase
LASAAQLIALGIDPEKSALFVQSHVPAHNQLAWVLECLTGFGEASRMTQFKDKSQKTGADRTVVGLFTYPILQAADILIYQANQVPVGEDQRQHIELTRDLAQRFNSKYGPILTIPEGYILKAGAKINDLQEPTAKMSKSAASPNGIIELMDKPEVNAKKIKSAVTDTGKEIVFDETNKPGVSNLLTIYTALSGKTISDAENEFAGKGYGDFKGAVADVVVEFLKPIQSKANDLLNDPAYLNKMLKLGADKANEVAEKTLKSVYDAIGIVPRS